MKWYEHIIAFPLYLFVLALIGAVFFMLYESWPWEFGSIVTCVISSWAVLAAIYFGAKEN